jgi:hypothetical protein
MVVNGFGNVFLLGCFGGSLGILLHWYRLRESEGLPKYAKSILYWLISIFMIIAGGILATLYGIVNVNAILTVHIGISSPLIISGMASTLPTTSTRGVDFNSWYESITRFLRCL